jgi:hypothetical protein
VKDSKAKSLAWVALGSIPCHVVGKCELVCIEIEARMDSFVAVLTMLGRSSMYKFLSVADQEG